MEVWSSRWSSSEGPRSPRALGGLKTARSDVTGEGFVGTPAGQRSEVQRRRSSSFQTVKQQLLSFSQPTAGAAGGLQGPSTHAGGPLAETSADLTEQLRKLDFKGALENCGRGPPASAASSRFPFSCAQPQRPVRRGRPGAFGGASLGASRRPSLAGAAAAHSSGRVMQASSSFGHTSMPPSLQQQQQHQQQEEEEAAARKAGSFTSTQGRGPSTGSSEEGPLFCSPGAPDEADFSTSATMPHESATVQQQQGRQQQQQQQEPSHEHAQQVAGGSWHRQQQLHVHGGERGAPWVEDRGRSVPLSVRLGRAVSTLAAVFHLSLTATVVVAAVGGLVMLGYSLLWDILLQEQQRQAEAAAEAAACRQKHRENGCESLNPIPPFLRKPCEEWRACLMAVPEHHGETTKVAAQVLAQVLNAFFQSLHWRTIVAAAAFLWLSLYAYRTFSPASSHVHAAAGCASCNGSQWGASALQAVAGAMRPPALAVQQHALALPQQLQQQHASTLLSDLGHEMNVLKQQILRGSEPHLILATLGRQDALQRELASILNAEPALQQQQQRRQEAADRLQAGGSSNVQHAKQQGFIRSLIGSWVFKFLILLWVGYACVVGCMYALRHDLFQLEAFEIR
ncbi:hypothetical protein ACSSS7_006437 [Eimeria intestinalis]